MAVADRKEMLMICLANIRREYEVILVFLVHIVYAEALPRRISESCNDIVFYYFQSFRWLVFPDLERVLCRKRDPVVVIDTLIGE